MTMQIADRQTHSSYAPDFTVDSLIQRAWRLFCNRFGHRRARISLAVLNQHLRRDIGLRDTGISSAEARQISRQSTNCYPIEHPLRYSIWTQTS